MTVLTAHVLLKLVSSRHVIIQGPPPDWSDCTEACPFERHLQGSQLPDVLQFTLLHAGWLLALSRMYLKLP